MIELDFQTSFSEPLTVALGFFDCVHRGHRRLIAETVRLAERNGSLPAVFTFRNDISEIKSGKRLAISYRDRLVLFDQLGIRVVVSANFDENFAAQSPAKFLKRLDDSLVLEGLTCGEDYRFGKGAAGDAARLEKFAKKCGIDFSCVPLLEVNGEKISSTEIRRLLAAGDFEALEKLSGAPFFRTGKVVQGFHAGGSALGIRTANVEFGENLAEIGDGVYRSQTLAAGRMFESVTFVGTSETFSRVRKTVECHLLGFDGDLYGQEIRVFFLKKLRDNRKFESFDALSAQIRNDIAGAWSREEKEKTRKRGEV